MPSTPRSSGSAPSPGANVSLNPNAPNPNGVGAALIVAVIDWPTIAVDVGASGEKQPHHRVPLVLGGAVQRGAPALVGRIGRREPAQQLARQLEGLCAAIARY